MIPRLTSIAHVTLLCVLIASPLGAQTTDTPDTRFARTLVEAIPIGATVTLRTRDGERLKAILFSADEAGIRVKPATRIPEPSRRIAYDQIERIERDQDHVSVGKYAGVGVAIGAAVLLLLLAGV
jgi:endonuclease III